MKLYSCLLKKKVIELMIIIQIMRNFVKFVRKLLLFFFLIN